MSATRRWPSSSRCRVAISPPATSSTAMHGVDQHAWDAGRLDAVHLGLWREGGDNEQPVRAVTPVEELERAALPVLRLDVEDHQVVPRTAHTLDDSSDALHGGGIREPGQKRRHDHRSLEGEAAGERARAVVQRLDRLDDPLPGARPHTYVAVEDARNRRDADTGQRGDIRDAGGATGRAWRSGW
jgi:hypothetical protein